MVCIQHIRSMRAQYTISIRMLRFTVNHYWPSSPLLLGLPCHFIHNVPASTSNRQVFFSALFIEQRIEKKHTWSIHQQYQSGLINSKIMLIIKMKWKENIGKSRVHILRTPHIIRIKINTRL